MTLLTLQMVANWPVFTIYVINVTDTKIIFAYNIYYPSSRSHYSSLA